MRNASLRRTGLLAALSLSTMMVAVGVAHAQGVSPTPQPPARRAAAQTAMSPYAKTVSPERAARATGAASDPLEPLNRKIFAFNQVLDKVLIRPLAVFWHHAAPKPIRQGINNFLSNLGEPVVFINDVLQGHPATAAGTATRFVANSTIGLLGVLDVTGATGLPHHDNGFGLTLGRWGVKSGPYLYLPLLGPSTLRDGIGEGIDVAANPLTYARNTGDGGLTTGLGVIGGLDARAEADSDLKALQALSTDPYAALRSFYLQNRQAQITGGKIDLDALPDFDDPGAGPTSPAASPASPAPPPAPGGVGLSAEASLAPTGVSGTTVAAALPDSSTPSPAAEAAPPPPAAAKGV